jgi:hypothetical protein
LFAGAAGFAGWAGGGALDEHAVRSAKIIVAVTMWREVMAADFIG